MDQDRSGPDGLPEFVADATAERIGAPPPDSTTTAPPAPSVDAPSGRLTLSVPLPGSAARGLSPGLALTYDSHGGHSPFGFGWSLPLSSIGPHTRDGLPRYDGSDVYALDGGEELVPELDGTEPNAELHRERATIAGVEYHIERFRPRIDNALTRVERLRSTATGAVHWRVHDGDGSTRVYGQSAEARIADPDDPDRVHRWLIERVHDLAGNCIHYAYAAEDGRGVAGNVSAFANRLIKRVSYGALTPFDPATEALPRFAFATVLDYGDHDEDAPTPVPDRDWPARPDPHVDRRAGFAVRTHRLCRRVLHFHDLPELGTEPTLTLALRLDHDLSEGRSMLVAVVQQAAERDGGGYRVEAMPAQRFGYSPFAADTALVPLAGADGGAPAVDPATRLGSRARGPRVWADLEGSGLPGLLTEEGGALRFARNLGEGRLGDPEPLASAPVPGSLANGTLTLEPVHRDGRVALVLRGASAQGFFELDERGEALPFVPFDAVARHGRDARHVHVHDADGDGFADMLCLGERPLLARGHGTRGVAPFEEVEGPERPEPRLGGTHAVRLADMTGDGLQDIVEVGAREVRYWPALGHGRFDAPVTMKGAPALDRDGAFDPARVVLASLTGGGPADLAYADAHGLRYALNHDGEGFGPERAIAGAADPTRSLAAVDVTGRGMPALVVSTKATEGETSRYVVPAGETRPFLLTSVANGVGASAAIEYTSSAVLAAEAAARGEPWRATPPFAVQCVTRVARTDHLRDHTTTERFAYAHAHFDAAEREFRGFARVDRWDGPTDLDAAALADPFVQPTLHVRSWYDTGLPFPHPISPEALSAEWWDEDGIDAPYRPAPSRAPPGVPPAEAGRARRGGALRVERYALDGTAAAATPIDVTTGTQAVVLLQDGTSDRPTVLRAVPGETVTVTYDRSPDDPAVEHTSTLERDALGMSLLAASISYGRRRADASLPAPVTASQRRTLVTVAEREFTADAELPAPARGFLRRKPWRRLSWSLEGQVAPGGLFGPADLLAAFESAPVVGYEASTGTAAAKRPTGETRDAYLADDLAAERPFGELGRWPIVARRYALALTPGLRAAAWPAGFVADADLDALGYRDLDGDGRSWAPSGRSLDLDPARFLLPGAVEDANGTRTELAYDAHALNVVREEDALGNAATVEIDYRTGQPSRSTDANGTVSEVAFDTLGRVVARAVRGPNGEGDTLAEPTARFAYDAHAFERDGTPNWHRRMARETHADAATRWFESVHYVDGEGGGLQSRERVAPGPADAIVAGTVTTRDTDPRWRVSGKARLTNKGAPAAAFDPFFGDTDAYGDDPRLTERGGATVTTLDAEGEPLRTDHPDGTFERTEHTPWRSLAYDRNDTVRESSLYDALGAPDPTRAAPADGDAHAAWVAARHADTPSETHRDAGGAVVYERHPIGSGVARTLRMERVPGGHRAESFDSADRSVLAERFDLLGRRLETVNMEEGAAHLLHGIDGKPERVRQSDGTVHVFLYDALRRPLGTRAIPPGGGTGSVPTLTLYGEAHPDAAASNLRDRPVAILDGSGATLIERYDFQGRPVRAAKRYLDDPLVEPDWGDLLGLAPAAALAAAEARLDAERFVSTTAFDAAGKPTESVTPDGTRLSSGYDEGGNRVTVSLTPPGAAGPVEILRGQDFDAFGAAEGLDLGDGTRTDLTWDPALRRLTRQTVTRQADGRALLDVAYTHDPVGNVTTLDDLSAEDVYFDNAVVTGRQRFEYDALYQLTRASGRELAALSHAPWGEVASARVPHANDANAVRRYTRAFAYDVHGNLTEIHHQAGAAAWRRRMRYAAATNRIEAVSAPGDSAGTFSLGIVNDARGRMVSGGGLGPMEWGGDGSLREIDLGGGGTARYVTGAGGARVRKIITRANGQTDEWLYLGALDVFRRRQADGTLIEERRTLRVMHAGRLLARIETKTVDVADASGLNVPLVRFRHADLTGSIAVDTSEAGAVLHHESYHPFGTTAYRSSVNDAEAALARYRYADRETDAESGLVAMGHRYYARWLGRFVSPDPAGPVEGANLYAYARNNPIMRSDRGGMQSNEAPDISWEEIQRRAREQGGTISPEVTAENYKDYWNGSQFLILVDPDTGTDTAEPGEPTGPGGDGSEESTVDPPAPPPEGTEGDGPGGEAAGPGTEDGEGEQTETASEEDGPGGGDGRRQQSPFLPDSSGDAGAAAVTTANSWMRDSYAKGNISRATEQVSLIDDAIRNNDPDAAWKAARDASDMRDKARSNAQRRMRWTGGEKLSQLIDRGRPFDKTRAYYEGKPQKPLSNWGRRLWNAYTPGLPTHTPSTPAQASTWQQTTRNIAIGSGKTNRFVSGLSKVGKFGGPIGTAVGVGFGAHAVYDAAPGDRGRVAAGEVGAFIGGAVGFAAGSFATAAAIGFLVSNPVGWAVTAITVATFVGGAIGAYFFAEGGRAIGESFF